VPSPPQSYAAAPAPPPLPALEASASAAATAVRTGPRPLAGLVTALRALRRSLTLAMAEPSGTGSESTTRLPVPSTEDQDLPRTVPGAFFTCIGLVVESIALAVLLPARYVIAGLRTVLEFGLKLPFRLLAIAWRLVFVVAAVLASVFAFMIIFRVFGSILSSVLRF